MNRKTIISICLIISVLLIGCTFQKNNALSGKNRDERIIMSLENTYPEIKFSVVKGYKQYKNKSYGVYKDENGLKFKVNNILYDNFYHFGCYDEYLLEILKEQNYINYAENIAKNNGYDIVYDEENQTLELKINIDNGNVDTKNIAKILLNILNSVDIPNVNYPDSNFSTGVVNYYTQPQMYYLFYGFTSSISPFTLQTDAISMEQREDCSIESLAEGIEDNLKSANEYKKKLLEEEQSDNYK